MQKQKTFEEIIKNNEHLLKTVTKKTYELFGNIMPSIDKEDIWQEACLALFLNKSLFENGPAYNGYLYKVLKSFILRELISTNFILSMPKDRFVRKAKENEEIVVADNAEDFFNSLYFVEDFDFRLQMEEFQKNLSLEEQAILSDLLNGLSAAEIGRKNGLSRMAICKKRKKIQNKYDLSFDHERKHAIAS